MYKRQVLNGLNFAAKNDPNFYLPWNTRYKSIVGGAKYIANYFINVGQNTNYTQKFNVVYKDKLYRNPVSYTHLCKNGSIKFKSTADNVIVSDWCAL